MKMWFFMHKGKPSGPLDEYEVLARIRRGELKRNDQLFMKGDSKWKVVQSFNEFEGEFPEKVEKALEQWVVLKREIKDGKKVFIQLGPFPSSIVKQQIQEGSFEYTDYIWRDGMSEWSRVSTVSEFNSTPQSERDFFNKVEVPGVPEFTVTEHRVEENRIKEFQHTPKVLFEDQDEVPLEADIHPKNTVSTTEVKKQEIFAEVGRLEEDIKSQGSSLNAVRVNGSKGAQKNKQNTIFKEIWCCYRQWVYIAFATGLIVGLGLVAYESTRETFLQKEAYVEKNVEIRKGKVSLPVTPRIEKKKKPVSIEKKNKDSIHEPSYAKLRKFKKKSGEFLVVKTDASRSIKLQIEVRSEFKDVLGGGSVHRFYTVSVGSDLDLSEMRPGRYVFRLNYKGQTLDKKTFFVGPGGKSFKSQLWLKKKSGAFKHQQEREKLIYITASCYKALGQLVAFSKTRNNRIWLGKVQRARKVLAKAYERNFLKINARRASKLVHYEYWLDYKMFLETAIIELKSKAVVGSIPNMPVKNTIKKLAQKAQRRHLQAKNLTLW